MPYLATMIWDEGGARWKVSYDTHYPTPGAARREMTRRVKQEASVVEERSEYHLLYQQRSDGRLLTLQARLCNDQAELTALREKN